MRRIKLITPEIASELINHGRKNNLMSRAKVEKYKKMMLSGKWMNGVSDTIMIKNGVLLDGRHRLIAIIETGLSFNIPFDDFT
jgi:hypothetical protein